VAAPEDAEPATVVREAMPANPRKYALDWSDGPLPEGAADFRASIFKATNTPTAFNIFVRDELLGTLVAGDDLGRCRLANKDGPLALRLPRPGEIWWQVVEPYWQNVDIYGDGATFLRTFADVPESAGHLLAIKWCESEVCNGGFHQFFGNPTGVLAPEAVLGFRAIGMPALADLVEQAMVVLDTPYPREQEQRRRFLDGIPGEHPKEWDPFFDLNDAFYAAMGDDSLCDAADAYAAQTMPAQARLNLTPEPQIEGRVRYMRRGLVE
jgi:hypothetical protein